MIDRSDYHPYHEDMYYKIVVLKNEETLFCAMEKDVVNFVEERYLKMIEPMVLQEMQEFDPELQKRTKFHFLNPWMPLADSDEYVIGTEMVKSVANMADPIKKQYQMSVSKLINIKVNHRHEVEKQNENKLIESKVMDFLRQESITGTVRIVDEE